jgi:hypothetical protein
LVKISTPSRPINVWGLLGGTAQQIYHKPEDLHCDGDLRCRCKQLFTKLDTDDGIVGRHHTVTKRYQALNVQTVSSTLSTCCCYFTDLPGNIPDNPGQRVLLHFSVLVPRCEVPQLSLRCLVVSSRTSQQAVGQDRTDVIPVVGHPHLRSNHQNLSIVDDDSAIVVIVLMSHRPGQRTTTGQPSGTSIAISFMTDIPTSQIISRQSG